MASLTLWFLETWLWCVPLGWCYLLCRSILCRRPRLPWHLQHLPQLSWLPFQPNFPPTSSPPSTTVRVKGEWDSGAIVCHRHQIYLTLLVNGEPREGTKPHLNRTISVWLSSLQRTFACHQYSVTTLLPATIFLLLPYHRYCDPIVQCSSCADCVMSQPRHHHHWSFPWHYSSLKTNTMWR